MKAQCKPVPLKVERIKPMALLPYCTERELLERRLDAMLPSEQEHPQALHRAMRHAVFAGGKRLRPRLCIAVAAACGVEAAGDEAIELALNAACGLEFLHCASLVHDDLPVFDDAPERRGRPTVHMLYGEPLAILTGDALLSLSYEVIAGSPARLSRRAVAIIRLMGMAAGSREGIIGGQSMEQCMELGGGTGKLDGAGPQFSPDVVERYHRMKTAAMFQLAASAGALAAGDSNRHGWAEVGRCLGLALQLADDLYDISNQGQLGGKPVGRDVANDRPNAALTSGETRTRQRMWSLLQQAHSMGCSLAKETRPLVTLLQQATAYFRMVAD